MSIDLRMFIRVPSLPFPFHPNQTPLLQRQPNSLGSFYLLRKGGGALGRMTGGVLCVYVCIHAGRQGGLYGDGDTDCVQIPVAPFHLLRA